MLPFAANMSLHCRRVGLQAPRQFGRVYRRLSTSTEDVSPLFALSNPSLLQHNAFINGSFVPALAGATFEVTDPANDSHVIVSNVADCDVEDTKAAISAANAAFEGPDWGMQSLAKERAVILKKWAELMHEVHCCSHTVNASNCGFFSSIVPARRRAMLYIYGLLTRAVLFS